LTVFACSARANTFVLVIDPGHGGKDTGALGRKGKEKNINLAVAALAGQYIANEHPDVKIVYTRTKDVFIGLDERADIANKANANLFISIHSNALDREFSNFKGAEVYTFGVTRAKENLEVAKRENSVIMLEDNYEQKYSGYDPNSAESSIMFEFMVNLYADQSINFASMVEKELVKTAGRYDGGVKQAGYLVLRKSAMPRILIELDYISNPKSEDYLLSSEGQKNLARSISNAFTEYKKEFDRKEKNATAESPVKQPSEVLPDTGRLPAPTEQSVVKPTTATEKPAVPGKVYKVQILASVTKLPDKSRELKGYDADYYVEGKYYKYTVGESTDWNEINSLRQKIAGDFKNAFIIAFENGIKVSVK
jgi:N-acetylmuramoyl-L-alanine amidase